MLLSESMVNVCMNVLSYDPAGGIRLSMTSITPVRRISKQNQRNFNKPERYSEPEYSSPATSNETKGDTIIIIKVARHESQSDDRSCGLVPLAELLVFFIG